MFLGRSELLQIELFIFSNEANNSFETRFACKLSGQNISCDEKMLGRNV
jgi:hypothetical protein